MTIATVFNHLKGYLRGHLKGNVQKKFIIEVKTVKAMILKQIIDYSTQTKQDEVFYLGSNGMTKADCSLSAF